MVLTTSVKIANVHACSLSAYLCVPDVKQIYCQ